MAAVLPQPLPIPLVRRVAHDVRRGQQTREDLVVVSAKPALPRLGAANQNLSWSGRSVSWIFVPHHGADRRHSPVANRVANDREESISVRGCGEDEHLPSGVGDRKHLMRRFDPFEPGPDPPHWGVDLDYVRLVVVNSNVDSDPLLGGHARRGSRIAARSSNAGSSQERRRRPRSGG
jgi:hypothetical protein